MILVTVGTHNQGFNRLVAAADAYAARTAERVVIQRGTSTHLPQHAEHFTFTGFERMQELTREARVVVTHAAAGAILLGLQLGKPLVLVPRKKLLGEIYDDHQFELVRALCGAGRAVECAPVTAAGLAEAVRAAAVQPVKPAGSDQLVKNLRRYLNDCL